MADKTGIEWTDATWNPVTGCTKVSAGCDNCYAETFAERWRGTPGHYFENGFDVQLRPDKLELPLRWKRPRRIFVNSMSDLFHDQVSDEYIARVFAVMALAPRHTFQVLTKRHARMRSLLNSSAFQTATAEQLLSMTDADDLKDAGDPFPLPNVWLGVSAENQQWADIRIPALLDTPAAVRFVSAEPLLGPIDLTSWIGCPHDSLSGVDQEPIASPTKRWRCDQCRASVLDGTVTNVGLHWIITGGESGPGARPAHPDWFRSIRDQCQAAGVAYLHKQWGEWRPVVPDVPDNRCATDYLVPVDGSDAVRIAVVGRGAAAPEGPWATMRRVGKHRAGRELDGRTWDQYPGEAS